MPLRTDSFLFLLGNILAFVAIVLVLVGTLWFFYRLATLPLLRRRVRRRFAGQITLPIAILRCPKCHTPGSLTHLLRAGPEASRGGWTCPRCGHHCEGLPEVPIPARHDICEAENRTQRGDAS